MKTGMTKSQKRSIFICIIVIILAVALLVAGYFWLKLEMADEWQAKVDEVKNELNANKRITYVADMDIAAGEVVDSSNCSLCKVSSDMPDELLTHEGELGGRALVDIKAGTQIFKSFLSEDEYTADVRQVEYKFIYSGINISEGDMVDIRILFPDAVDQVVASKKRVEAIGEGGELVFNVTEEEIQLLDAAVVDAFTYSAVERYTIDDANSAGKYVPTQMSRIYVAKYVQPTLQDASVPFYVPGELVINAIKNDPNIVGEAKEYMTAAVRAEFEARMFKYMNPDVADVLGMEQFEADDIYKTWEKYYSGEGTDKTDSNDTESGDSDEDDLSKYYR